MIDSFMNSDKEESSCFLFPSLFSCFACLNDCTLFKLNSLCTVKLVEADFTTQVKLSVSPKAGLNHVFHIHVGEVKSGLWLPHYTISSRCAILSYPSPFPASAISTSVSSSPESPTIFTRLRRALTFLNEKALFAALQQLTIYDNEASLES